MSSGSASWGTFPLLPEPALQSFFAVSMKYAQCDNCGEKDDWMIHGNAFLPGGVVIRLRPDSGGEECEHELELCDVCRNELLDKFPKLKKAIER